MDFSLRINLGSPAPLSRPTPTPVLPPSGYKIWLDGSDASAVVLEPASVDVAKWVDKSPGAWDHDHTTIYATYDASGNRLDYSTNDSYLATNGVYDLGFAGKKSVTIGMTLNPVSPSINVKVAYCLSDSSFTTFKDTCFVGTISTGTPKYRFVFDTDLFDAGTPTPGTPQSVVFRYKNISPGVAEYNIWVDGVKTGPLAGTATGAFPNLQYSLSGRTFWFDPSGTTYWSGYIHQTFAYDTALSDADVAQLITFLDSKK